MVVGGAVAVVAVVVGLSSWQLWYHNTYKTELQTLEVPGRGLRFVLMTDIAGFEDPAWYVYEIPIGHAPPASMRRGHDTSGVLFWNYDEANELVDDVKLEIVGSRFLVLSRSGLYFSLYDLDSRRVLVNDFSPWNTFVSSGGAKKYGDNGQAIWVRDTIHRRIAEIIAPSNNALERTRGQ